MLESDRGEYSFTKSLSNDDGRLLLRLPENARTITQFRRNRSVCSRSGVRDFSERNWWMMVANCVKNGTIVIDCPKGDPMKEDLLEQISHSSWALRNEIYT